MSITQTAIGVTFPIDDVSPARERLREHRAHEAVRQLLESDIESCSDYHTPVMKDVRFHPLLAAVYTAFSHHRPLILSPDAVWITIAQGVAHHMVIHGERLRSRFVAHQGKIDLEYNVADWIDGSPENPWAEAFANWTSQIRDHVGSSYYDTFVSDFSTTGAVERAASQVVMMDVFQRYFHYVMVCICGIPTVTLEGTTADWERLFAKVRSLRIFDMDWWLDGLEPICQQFIRASRGDVDRKHWQNICKLRSQYGGAVINGWVAKLFPYIRSFWNGPSTKRNPIFDDETKGFQTIDAPSGLSRVPFTCRNLGKNTERKMEAIGGLIGVTQSPDTGSLRPIAGWAIRPAPKMDVVLARIAEGEEHVKRPGLGSEDRSVGPRPPRDFSSAEFARFYDAHNGVTLFAGSDHKVRILPLAQHTPLPSNSKRGREWTQFVKLADGSSLAFNPYPADRFSEMKQQGPSHERRYVAICHVRGNWNGPAGHPVVATSFSQLLENLLDHRGKAYWTNPEFSPLDDAAAFTRT